MLRAIFGESSKNQIVHAICQFIHLQWAAAAIFIIAIHVKNVKKSAFEPRQTVFFPPP
jgi:hypothetical protein